VSRAYDADLTAEEAGGFGGLGALRKPAARRRLSASAVRLFLNLAERWGLSVDQRCQVLGDISRATYHNWRKGHVGVLTRDQIERISLALGIQKALRLIFADNEVGPRWLKAPNTDEPFGGRSPLELMSAGGIRGLYEVRRYLDAWRGVR
jgi:hypothetical protein